MKAKRFKVTITMVRKTRSVYVVEARDADIARRIAEWNAYNPKGPHALAPVETRTDPEFHEAIAVESLVEGDES